MDIAMFPAYFLVIFALGTAGMLGVQVLRLRKFTQISALVTKVDKEEAHSEGFGKVYNMRVSYEYTIDARKYTGSSVSILDVGSNQLFTNYDENLFSNLKYALENSVTIEIWVNPKNPADSILTKKIYWRKFVLFLLLVLVAIGAIIVTQ